MKKNIVLRGAFGAELLQLRKTAGLSADALASAIEVSKNTVYRWENAQALPSPRSWSALLEYCKKNAIDTVLLSRAYVYTELNPSGTVNNAVNEVLKNE